MQSAHVLAADETGSAGRWHGGRRGDEDREWHRGVVAAGGRSAVGGIDRSPLIPLLARSAALSSLLASLSHVPRVVDILQVGAILAGGDMCMEVISRLLLACIWRDDRRGCGRSVVIRIAVRAATGLWVGEMRCLQRGAVEDGAASLSARAQQGGSRAHTHPRSE